MTNEPSFEIIAETLEWKPDGNGEELSVWVTDRGEKVVLRRSICRNCNKKFVYKKKSRGRKRKYCNECSFLSARQASSEYPREGLPLYMSRERKFEEKLCEENQSWISLNNIRPDMFDFKRSIWIELKIALRGRFYSFSSLSKYFPSLYFNCSIDEQINAYINTGFCPLEVIVLDAVTGKMLTKRLFNK